MKNLILALTVAHLQLLRQRKRAKKLTRTRALAALRLRLRAVQVNRLHQFHNQVGLLR